MAEKIIERLVLYSRWLLVPLYLALCGILLIFAFKAVQEVIYLFQIVLSTTKTDLILATLSLIDLTLVANLLVIVILSGYETFISRIDVDENTEKPSWLGKLEPGEVKIKLAVAIVSISAIHVLKIFMKLDETTAYPQDQLIWLVIIHLTLVVSALLIAFIDRVSVHHD